MDGFAFEVPFRCKEEYCRKTRHIRLESGFYVFGGMNTMISQPQCSASRSLAQNKSRNSNSAHWLEMAQCGSLWKRSYVLINHWWLQKSLKASGGGCWFVRALVACMHRSVPAQACSDFCSPGEQAMVGSSISYQLWESDLHMQSILILLILLTVS